ncbi:hypothetical protein LINPERHAP2_LOCUS21513 [Linum perenne]
MLIEILCDLVDFWFNNFGVRGFHAPLLVSRLTLLFFMMRAIKKDSCLIGNFHEFSFVTNPNGFEYFMLEISTIFHECEIIVTNQRLVLILNIWIILGSGFPRHFASVKISLLILKDDDGLRF